MNGSSLLRSAAIWAKNSGVPSGAAALPVPQGSSSQ